MVVEVEVESRSSSFRPQPPPQTPTRIMASKSAKASYKKEDGTLSLSKTHLLWTPATRASGVIEESLDKVAGE